MFQKKGRNPFPFGMCGERANGSATARAQAERSKKGTRDADELDEKRRRENRRGGGKEKKKKNHALVVVVLRVEIAAAIADAGNEAADEQRQTAGDYESNGPAFGHKNKARRKKKKQAGKTKHREEGRNDHKIRTRRGVNIGVQMGSVRAPAMSHRRGK